MIKRIKSKFGSLWKFIPGVVSVSHYNKYGRYDQKKVEKHLTYSSLAKQLVKAHPNLIKNFLAQKRVLSKPGQKSMFGNMVLENISGEVKGHTATNFYRLLVDGRAFFIKEIKRGKQGSSFDPRYDSPQVQIKAAEIAREKIKSIKELENVEVVKTHLGFSGSDSLFLVTDYHPGYSLDQIKYDKELSKKYPGANKESARLLNQLESAFAKTRITDFGPQNILFVPSTGKFVLIDLRLV
jgi:hypothetical protein